MTDAAATVQVVHTDQAPAHTGPVPQAVEAGGWIFVSALFGADPVGHAIPADAQAQLGERHSDPMSRQLAIGAERERVQGARGAKPPGSRLE